MKKRHITAVLSAIVLISCGGGGGGSDNSSNGGGGSGNGGSGSGTPGANSTIGAPIERVNNTYQTTVNGVLFTSEALVWKYGQPILYQQTAGSERKAYIAIEGEYVSGYGGSYSSDSGTIAEFAFFGLDGTPSAVVQNGTVGYNGVYMQADASNPTASNFAYQATLSVNFDNGQITGQTINVQNPSEQATFSGEVDGNNVTINVTDQFGTHEAVGAIYGPAGTEIAAGYEDGVISGLIYGEQ